MTIQSYTNYLDPKSLYIGLLISLFCAIFSIYSMGYWYK